jgi:hypothetical protein
MQHFGRLLYTTLVLVFFVGSGSAYAQEICYEEGEFGPTCAVTAVPTSPPTKGGPLPTNPPPAPIPVSGNVGVVSVIIFGASAVFLLGFGFSFARRE